MPTTHTCANCHDWIHFEPRHRFSSTVTQRDISGGVWKHTLPNRHCRIAAPTQGVTPADSLRAQGKSFEGN